MKIKTFRTRDKQVSGYIVEAPGGPTIQVEEAVETPLTARQQKKVERILAKRVEKRHNEDRPGSDSRPQSARDEIKTNRAIVTQRK